MRVREITTNENADRLYRRVLAAPVVPQPWRHDRQLYDVLEDDELDLDWHATTLPMAEIAKTVDLSLDANPGCDPQEEQERFARIAAWIDQNGGAEAALRKQPPAFLLGPNGLLCVDGRHRLALAEQAGLNEVPALVALTGTRSPIVNNRCASGTSSKTNHPTTRPAKKPNRPIGHSPTG